MADDAGDTGGGRPMKAWTLGWDVEYEGTTLLGVYESRDAGKVAAVKYWSSPWHTGHLLLLECWEGSELLESKCATSPEGPWRDWDAKGEVDE